MSILVIWMLLLPFVECSLINKQESIKRWSVEIMWLNGSVGWGSVFGIPTNDFPCTKKPSVNRKLSTSKFAPSINDFYI